MIKSQRGFLMACVACVILIFCAGPTNCSPKQNGQHDVWSTERAWKWYNAHPWINGSNYVPHTAINQLEMWQQGTFDSVTIDKEFIYAEGLGMNTMRVFLHSLAWKQDPAGFKNRINVFLTLAHRHGITPLFVFFDDCWNKEPKIGVQPVPKPGIHNSGWMQDPGQPVSEDSSNYPLLEKYVKDILGTYGRDSRILLWDLYNEPGNSKKGDKSLLLLKKVFTWAREMNPDQPISAGVWDRHLTKLTQFQIQHSDVITYHDYTDPDGHADDIKYLRQFGRPLICTEYMARKMNSRFENIMPMLKREHIGAINWGFVTGKTNTMYAWDTPIPDGSEPKEWFHDIFRQDGTPYKASETNTIKKLNGKMTELIILKNSSGMEATITNYGARIVSLLVPTGKGQPVDVVVGPGTVEGFSSSTEPFFGATIGRYANRIAGGKFVLDGVTYTLPINNGPNTLHGGPKGFHNQIWQAKKTSDSSVVLHYVSKDMEQGFPGNMNVKLTYILTSSNGLRMDYEAITDKKTVINLTNHAFFNLNGIGSETILDHQLSIMADRYTPIGSTLIPTGKMESVANTPFDFRHGEKIGRRIHRKNQQLMYGKGYDHNFILNQPGLRHPAATIVGDKTGIQLTIFTDQPGLQFYSGNAMQAKNTLKRNFKDDFRTAFALESQHFPDSPNEPQFPSTTLSPGETYKTTTIYQFK